MNASIAVALNGPFVPEMRPGEIWRREHGVYIASEADCGPMGRCAYDHESGWRARTCAAHGIPTGCCMPIAAADLINRAVSRALRPDKAEPMWAEARRVLMVAQETMARRMAA